jgi:putative nucleotidyltransferase with HDIG domain
MPRSLKAFLSVVTAIGAGVVAHSVLLVAHPSAALNGYFVVLALLTIVSGRFVIGVPGRHATVSVSEVFLFAIVALFGPAAATITVAVDGLWTSFTHKHRRAYRALFNIAEPAVSIWAAGHVYFLIAHHGAGSALAAAGVLPLLSGVGLFATFFALNSGLTAVAIALESGASAYDVWRRHAGYLAVNYYAAASLVTLAIGDGLTINLPVVGLVVPLLILSYVAYQEASTRIGAAHQHLKEVERLYHAATEMLAIAVDAKDQVTHGHIRRVQQRTVAVARALGVSDANEVKALEAGALLHDIGKLAVPDYVLNKPTALSRAEFDVMKMHAPMGARILQAVDFPYPVVPVVRHHHEQWNGGGYPDGLVGAEIPLGARILAVVDCFDALTSDRPYRPRLSNEQAIDLIRSRRGTFYDPAVVDKFIELIPTFEATVEVSEVTGLRDGLVAGFARTPQDGSRKLDPDQMVSGRLPRRAIRHLEEGVRRLPDAEACLFQLNQAGDTLTVGHATAPIRDQLSTFCLSMGAGVSGWVVANRNTIRRADATLDLGDLASHLNLRMCVSTPVFVQGELRGALTVYTRDFTGLPDSADDRIGMLAQELGLLIAEDLRDPAPAPPVVVRTPSADTHSVYAHSSA